MQKTATEPILAWHFLPDDGMTRDFDGQRERVKVKPGTTLTWDGELKMCESGLHASTDITDALSYAPGAMLCRVECSGDIIEGDDKICCTKRKCLWMIDATRTLHEFACWCAEEAFARERESGREPDPRSVAAIQAKRDWLDGMITDDELTDARDAAWAAAGNAAWAAAWSAAEAAARSAAWSAAWAAQREKLLEMVEAERRRVVCDEPS